MKRIYTFLLLAVGFLASAQNGQTCAEAFNIGQGTFNVIGFSGPQLSVNCIPGGIPNGPNTIWYRYTAVATETIEISSDLPNIPEVDTRLHVFTDDCSALTCIAGNDDISNNNLNSALDLAVVAGESYLIAWDNYWEGSSFSFKITDTSTPPPPAFSFNRANLSLPGDNLAIVDMDNDGLDDLVSVISNSVLINYQNANGSLTGATLSTPTADNLPFWSLAAADFDKNGYTDLLYGGGSGVTFMKANATGTGFAEISGSEYVFSQRSNFIDINNDGHLDAFVCHDVQPNVYYINDGNGNLQFYQGADPSGVPSGLGLVPNGGNYGTIWIDYDNDRDMDLFISKCRGGSSNAKINELHRNNGDGTFTNVAGDAGVNLADPIQTWSSAWADFDKDGDLDIFIGVSSYSDGGHKMMQNNGDGTFTDITNTIGSDISALGTGRENTAVDFDNDGHIDIYSSGRILRNNGDMTFSLFEGSAIPRSGALGDMNGDGYIDVYSNDGLFYNQNFGNNWLIVRLEGVQSNAHGIGARIEITGASTGNQIREIRSGEGFEFMSSMTAHFGLDQDATVDMTIYWPSGNISNLSGVDANQLLTVNEGTTASITPVDDLGLSLFPNPAVDQILITASQSLENSQIQILDLHGKVVLKQTWDGSFINVSKLKSGLYFLQVEHESQVYSKRFLKN